jgi:hypothetical protein
MLYLVYASMNELSGTITLQKSMRRSKASRNLIVLANEESTDICIDMIFEFEDDVTKTEEPTSKKNDGYWRDSIPILTNLYFKDVEDSMGEPEWIAYISQEPRKTNTFGILQMYKSSKKL